MLIDFWFIFGLSAQACFFFRFFIQWIVSEKKKKSVIPVHFWYLSLLGGIGLLIYSLHIMDPVFIIGQSAGIFIYVRNLIFIRRDKNENKT